MIVSMQDLGGVLQVTGSGGGTESSEQGREGLGVAGKQQV